MTVWDQKRLNDINRYFKKLNRAVPRASCTVNR